MSEKPFDYCIWKCEATLETPCRGEAIYSHSTDAGDDFYTCEGHMAYSMYSDAEQNRAKYRHPVKEPT